MVGRVKKIAKLISLFFFLFVTAIFGIYIFTGEKETVRAQIADKAVGTTRIMISVSEPTEFEHYLKKDPPRLVIEFKNPNVFSQMEKEVIVQRGVVKSVGVEYYEESPREIGGLRAYPLKSLVFGLLQFSSYRITQTDDMIIVEIKNPANLKAAALSIGEVEITDIVRTEGELRAKEKALRKSISDAEIKLKGEKEKIIERPLFFPFRRLIFIAVFAIIFVMSVILLYDLGRQLLKKLFARGRTLRPEEWILDRKLDGFQHLERISPTLLGRLVLKSFEKMGYRLIYVKDIDGRTLTSVLEKDNKKVLYRYVCKDAYFDRVFVEDFVKTMIEENAGKGYLVTTGTFTYPASTLAKKRSIELIGKERLVELIHSYLEEDLTKELEKVKNEMQNTLEALEKEKNNITYLASEREALQQKFAQISERADNLRKDLFRYKDLEQLFVEREKDLKKLSNE